MAVTTTIVGGASTQVIGTTGTDQQGSGRQRRKLTLHNPNVVGQQNVCFTQAPAAAVLDSGICLLPGEKYDIFGDDALAAWNAIGSAAGAKATVIEYLYAAGNLPQGYAFVLPVG
jgi:hypothetical protein